MDFKDFRPVKSLPFSKNVFRPLNFQTTLAVSINYNFVSFHQNSWGIWFSSAI